MLDIFRSRHTCSEHATVSVPSLLSPQFLNFVLMPLYLRTAFMGCSAFLWATFLCFSRQNGDGTAAVALAWIMAPKKRLLTRKTKEEK